MLPSQAQSVVDSGNALKSGAKFCSFLLCFVVRMICSVQVESTLILLC